MTTIIDYGAGNIKSVEKALNYLGEEVNVTDDADTILNADRVILPGVGSFGDAMNSLKVGGLDAVIKEVAQKGTPLLGICLGLQLFFESSEESPNVQGLGILKGKVVRIPDNGVLKIPHMGWNALRFQGQGRLFEGLHDEDAYVYFVHSYYLRAEDENIVTAVTDYGTTIHAAVEKDKIFAVQFHPEKSSDVGLSMIKNFIKIN